MPQIPDVRVVDHGSIVVLQALTATGLGFLKDKVHSESWQWLTQHALAVEPRQARDLVCIMQDEGLAVN